MFLSLGIIFIVGFLGGWLFDKIKLPKLVFYIILGMLIGPSILNIVDQSLLDISTYLRQLALIIILTRSGLSLDFSTLKKIGRPAILMCFIPASFEMVGIAIFGPIILNISLFEALLLGSVLAAVSPAVVVPFMIKLQNEKYGSNHKVPELIMAGASCDDIFVIIMFYSFKSLVASSTFEIASLLNIPLSIFSGIILGTIFAIVLIFLFKKFKFKKTINVIIFFGTSFLMIGIENILKQYISISSLLGIIFMSMLVLKFANESAKEIKESYDSLWCGFEILLFTLVGCAINVDYALSKTGLLVIGVLMIGLLFRLVGVYVCIIATNYTAKEKIFIAISYLPKATVQASIGGIAYAEGLSCGSLILTSAVISILVTAPIGACLMQGLYKRLLNKEIDYNSCHEYIS